MSKIKLKFGMNVLFVLLLLIGVAFVGSANSNDSLCESVEYNAEDNTLDIDQTNSAEYTFIFGLSPSEHEVIASVGILPEFNTEEQKKEWTLRLEELNERLKDEMVSSHMYPYGEVLTCGYNSNGYLVILFENKTIEQETMDEIYTYVDEKARDLNIKDVPVEFGRGEYWQQYELDLDILNKAEIEADKEYMKSGRGTYQSIVIASYGKLPLLTTDEQRSDFGKDLMDILYEVRTEMEPYMYNGQVVEYSVFGSSVEVGINKNETDNVQMLCDDVYRIFDEEAIQIGINEIPVTFIETGTIVDDVLVVEPDVKKVSTEEQDVEVHLNNNESQLDNVSDRQVPGFGILGGFVCFFCGWIFRRN
ncbi:hypothetical protein [Methanococcoides burtonii]|uniref:Uncharacterized protein n=1 Tax=Methanococcoides burtonii (strain DSM 6242 / NBRC 107633 / OCM 468 / ACE-M) TaxID=259564 RepID=Q12V05_METBU|nr:hypothetical protein [Methanococcoides burtonii]ABE52721.1 Hypothetical protein Mbur_1838 [Methanococcoides burtonii DSM 6242]